MFLHAAAITKTEDPQSKETELVTDMAILVRRSLLKMVGDDSLDECVDVTEYGIVDPWTLICCAISALYFQENHLSEDDNNKLHAILDAGLKSWNSGAALLFCTTVHWSILAQYLPSVLDQYGISQFSTGKYQSRESLKLPNWLRYFPSHIQEYVETVITEKFGIVREEISNKKWQLSIRNRAISFSFLKHRIGNYEWEIEEFESHISQMYQQGNPIVRVRPEIGRVHILLYGYRTAGKSEICRLFKVVSDKVHVMKRATTRSGPFHGIDECTLTTVKEDKFDAKCASKEKELVACHRLREGSYGFYSSELDGIPPGHLLLYQVGWSRKAINSLVKEIRERFDNEPIFLLVLKPSADVLKKRLIELKKLSPETAETEVLRAKKFYQSILSSSKRNAKIIDTSSYKANSIYKCFAALQDVLVTDETVGGIPRYDAFLCHASEDKLSVVLPFAECMKRHHLKPWIDKQEIGIGNRFIDRIRKGLQKSMFAIVFFSDSFHKNWPQTELDVVLNLEVERKMRVWPILLGKNMEPLYKKDPWLECKKFALIEPYDPSDQVPIARIEEIVSELREEVERAKKVKPD